MRARLSRKRSPRRSLRRTSPLRSRSRARTVGKAVGEPDTGSGLRPEQLTISIFLVVVVVLGALLAVAYVRR